MSHPPDLSVRDLDDGTWHQPTQGDPSTPSPENPQSETTPPTSQTESNPGVDTLPPLSTATPSSSPDSKDSDEGTPIPDPDSTDEWDILPPPIVEKGQVIFGKYRLEEKIGEGAMGEVWLVENIQLDRRSALKLIKQEVAQNDKGWHRFKREARLMAQLTHPNAVAVYDFKRTHSMGYIEMEFVRGRSLDKYLAEFKGQPMTLLWTADILDQLCSVLQDAHGHVDEKRGKAKPIIHRDLKPSNLMLVDKKPPGQNLKVLDFGIAKMIEDEASPELTAAGDLVGTPAYMSPEQIRGGITKEGTGEIDCRSDLYSVGVLLYQFLTGSLPFKALSKMAMLAAHLNWQPPPMKEANPESQVPAQVERLVMSCLEKNPDRRPQSARELAEKFRAAIRGKDFVVEGPGASLALRVAAGCLVVAVLVCAGWWKFHGKAPIPIRDPAPPEPVTGEPNASAAKKVGPEKPREEPPTPSPSPLIAKWKSAGYETLDSDQLEAQGPSGKSALEYLPADLGDAPAGVKRKKDGLIFYCFKNGTYLPLKYRPEDPKELEGSWPKVLVRADGVKFIRISGETYARGDFTAQKPVADLQGNPCQTHQVAVSGFYIQETEVTNQEIEPFERDHANSFPLANWKDGLTVLTDAFKKPREEVLRYPAVLINRSTAQKFAESVGGRLTD